MAIHIQPISPIALDLFGLEIRWYALSYIAAFIIGYWMMRRLAAAGEKGKGKRDIGTVPSSLFPFPSKKYWDDLLTYVILGTIIGGRLGYVLFYNLSYFIERPLEIFAIWHGGMAFHGGLIGVIAAVFLFAWKCRGGISSAPIRAQNIAPLQNAFSILDLMAVVAPIGLFFGRLANFINMEVMGRETTSKLGVVFVDSNGMPIGDAVPRHASPLYEAALEGILLFIIMFALFRWTKLRERAGALGGIFGMLYAVFRIFAEQFRAPDAHIGFLTGWGLTMGQLLSALMFIAGAAIFAIAMRRNK